MPSLKQFKKVIIAEWKAMYPEDDPEVNQEALLEVQNRALERLMDDIYLEQLLKVTGQEQEKYIRNQMEKGTAPAPLQRLHDLNTEGESSSSKDYLITVNPRPEVSVTNLVSKTERYLERKLHDGGMAVVEQRGSDVEGMGEGAHTHILVKANQTDATFRKNTRNTFKTLVGIPSKHINIRRIREGDLPKVLKYITGDKIEPKKKKMVEIDRQWRTDLGLQHLYLSTAGTPYLLPAGESDSSHNPDLTLPE